MRKIQEIMRARYVEGNYPKLTILECYINTVHFGKGCDGIQTAAQYYFGKDAKDLTLLECASLAATIQTPTSKNPISGPEKNKERRELVLSEMLDQGAITKEEYDQAMSEELVVVNTGEKDAGTTSSGVTAILRYGDRRGDRRSGQTKGLYRNRGRNYDLHRRPSNLFCL